MHITFLLDGGEVYVLSTLLTVLLLVGAGYGVVRLVADICILLTRATTRRPPRAG